MYSLGLAGGAFLSVRSDGGGRGHYQQFVGPVPAGVPGGRRGRGDEGRKDLS